MNSKERLEKHLGQNTPKFLREVIVETCSEILKQVPTTCQTEFDQFKSYLKSQFAGIDETELTRLEKNILMELKRVS